jgi:hypothetical protein
MTSDCIVPAKNQKCVLEPASDDPSTVPLSDLLDDFALNAMAQLILVYAPEVLPNDAKSSGEWCSGIATTSYCMATAMMAVRPESHKIILEDSKEEEASAS